MGKQVELITHDGFKLGAYVAEPEGSPTAGLLVLQEIFGVNHHIRSVADRFAALGYLVIAPALFDRVEPGIELGYGMDTMQQAIDTRAKIPLEATLEDMAAAVQWLRLAGAKRVGAVGYCWGGSLAWLANTRLKVDASVSYYGGMIGQFAGEHNPAPAIFHFGEQDKHIPPSEWEAIRTAHPDLPVYVYDADHGFNCDERGSYNKPAADLALERTLQFFDNTLTA